ncbi:MAG: glycosyltransferase family 2 protein, partial [Halobacteriaceae archaeon]
HDQAGSGLEFNQPLLHHRGFRPIRLLTCLLNSLFMPHSPLVSVVIPTYYRNERLRNAIESINYQTYTNIEIIVVDDSGEEFAEHIVTEKSNSNIDLEYIPLQKNKGAHQARKVGVQSANGKYISFLDDDDEFTPDKISKQVNLIRQLDDVGIIYCGVERRNEFGDTIEKIFPDTDYRGDVLQDALEFRIVPCIPSTIFAQAEILKSINFPSNLGGADDISLNIELAQKTKFDFVSECLTINHSEPQSRSQSIDSYHGRERLLEIYGYLYDKYPGSDTLKNIRSNTL